MSFTWKSLLVATLTLLSALAFAQDNSDSGDDDQRLLTPGKLDAAEFDLHLQGSHQKFNCLYELQGKLQNDGNPLFSAITKEIGFLELDGAWRDITERYTLEDIKALDTDLGNFIKNSASKMAPNLVLSTKSCALD